MKFQETKLSRQDLSAALTMAPGYEAFLSCTRTTEKGRTCYSGTRVKVNLCFRPSQIQILITHDLA